MAETVQHDKRGTVRRKRSLTLDLIGGFLTFLVLLVVALVFSIVIEWIGILFFWPDLGAAHSARMLVTELEFLNRDFTEGVLNSSAYTVAVWISSQLYYWLFEWTHFLDVIAWAREPPHDAGAVRSGLAAVVHLLSEAVRSGLAVVVQLLSEYIKSAVNTTQVFGVRLAVALLTTPVFVLIGVAALVDGLVERDLRRYGGGNESSFIYHNVKPWMKPAVLGAWFIYLGLPVSVHPNWIFVPAATMYGLAVYLTTWTFKKYP